MFAKTPTDVVVCIVDNFFSASYCNNRDAESNTEKLCKKSVCVCVNMANVHKIYFQLISKLILHPDCIHPPLI